MTFFQIAGAVMLGLLPAASATHPAFAAFAMVPGSGNVTQFQVSETTQVPGKTLKPGSYSIVVVDHLSDRMVLRVSSSDGKELTTFLGVPATAQFPAQAGAGPVDMKGGKGKGAALRGFRFPDGTEAEFVYPKADAVSLAKANSGTIPAIDPASEGRAPANKLSRSDLELVTLWMLTPTRVGPGNEPAIEAARYQPPAGNVASASAPATGAPASGTAAPAAPAIEAKAVMPPKPARVRTQTMTALPHTASSLPVFWLVGMLALFGAGGLSVRRLGLVR